MSDYDCSCCATLLQVVSVLHYFREFGEVSDSMPRDLAIRGEFVFAIIATRLHSSSLQTQEKIFVHKVQYV